MNFSLHVRTLTGLEGLLGDELTNLGARRVEPRKRVVICEGGMELLYKANLWCRTAIRVLRPLSSFAATDERSFYRGLQRIDWSQWLLSTGTLAVDANVHSAFTTHSLFVAQLAKDAIVDQFRERNGERPSVDLKSPDVRIAISLFQDRATVFLDSSGDSLHKRGYRPLTGDAPLNEALAAGILKLSKWDPTTPLFDPMCGSGTFLIEAALLAKNQAPGLLRPRFGFQNWPDYDRDLFERLVAEARRAIRRDLTLSIRGADCHPQTAAIARANIECAGLSGQVTVDVADFFKDPPPFSAPATLVTNPPYDERLRLEDAGAFWEAVGSRLKKEYAGWSANLLCGTMEGMKRVGLRTSRRIELYNGAIECRLLQYEMHAGRMKDAPRPEKNETETPTVALPSKLRIQLETFTNRLKKNWKHLAKWAQREAITSWRVYNRDIPELPFVVDCFDGEYFLSDVPENSRVTEAEQAQYLESLMTTIAEVTQSPREKVRFRETQLRATPVTGEVTESGVKYPLDWGQSGLAGNFLELRRLRSLVRDEASGKRVLEVFSLDDSLGRAARAGNAESVVSIPFENREKVNELEPEFDLCVVTPPKTARGFELSRDQSAFFSRVLSRARGGAKIYVSVPSTPFEIDPAGPLAALSRKEITRQVGSPDFERSARRYYLFEVP